MRLFRFALAPLLLWQAGVYAADHCHVVHVDTVIPTERQIAVERSLYESRGSKVQLTDINGNTYSGRVGGIAVDVNQGNTRAYVVLRTGDDTDVLIPVSDVAAVDTGAKGVVEGARSRAALGVKKVREATDTLLRRKKGHVQAEEIDRILAKKVADAKARGIPWEQYLDSWMQDLIQRMGRVKTYPELEELMAWGMGKSPNFGREAREYLRNNAAVRWYYGSKRVSAVEEKIGSKSVWSRITKKKKRLEAKLAKAKTEEEQKAILRELDELNSEYVRVMDVDRETLRVGAKRVVVPARKVFSPEDFENYMNEMSAMLFQVNHHPGFHKTWVKSFGRFKFKKNEWKFWKNFADEYQQAFRGPYEKYVEGVTVDLSGKVRPEVIESFYQKGFGETIMHKMAEVLKSQKIRGLRVLDTKNPLKYFASNKELLKNPAVQREIRQLALEMTYVTLPLVTVVAIDNLVHIDERYEQLKRGARAVKDMYDVYLGDGVPERFEKIREEARKNPEKAAGRDQAVVDDYVESFNEHLKELFAMRTQLKEALKEAEDEGRPLEERLKIEADLDAVEMRIEREQELADTLPDGIKKRFVPDSE